MAASSVLKKPASILLSMHPLQRILLSLAFSLIAFFFIRKSHLIWVPIVAVLWDVFAFSFLLTSWIVLFTRPVDQIIKQANKEDGSRIFVMISTLISSFASMSMVLLLVITKNQSPGQEMLIVFLSVTGMVLSWAMVHTIFAFHYAHMYYDDEINKSEIKALNFPDEKRPDYVDFAYFSFVIGMTFQVSDVEISSRKIRRTALAHGLLSFTLNTFVVALTINLVAGLNK